jgi:hypothetical protein
MVTTIYKITAGRLRQLKYPVCLQCNILINPGDEVESTRNYTGTKLRHKTCAEKMYIGGT